MAVPAGRCNPAANAARAFGSATACRPRRKACRLASTATPLSSIARSIDCAEIGRAPLWYAAPTMSMLAVWVDPKSCSVSAPGSRYSPREVVGSMIAWMSEVVG